MDLHVREGAYARTRKILWPCDLDIGCAGINRQPRAVFSWIAVELKPP